jgi:Holliday junction DNA helicase RuvA
LIAAISGTVTAVRPSAVVVEVGGVGLLVACPPQTAAAVRPGESISLHTSLVVREESLTLYGFSEADERDAFEAVQTVSGVGPRTALAVLATMTPEDLRQAIARGDIASLTRVPGIGTKGAQRLVIELKDRLAPTTSPGRGSQAPWQDTVREALASLGWSARDADAAVAAVADAAGDDPDISVVLRAALQHLDRR